jgi:hypothetical protein
MLAEQKEKMKISSELKTKIKKLSTDGISFDFDNIELGIVPSLLDGITYFITKDGRVLLQELVEKLSDKETILSNEVQSFVIKMAIQMKIDPRKDEDYFKILEESIENSKVDNIVILPLIGVDLVDPFRIGSFVIYNKEQYISQNSKRINERMKDHLSKHFGSVIAVGSIRGNPASVVNIGKLKIDFELSRFKAFVPLFSGANVKYWISSLSTDVVLSDAALIINEKGSLSNSGILTHPMGINLDRKFRPEHQSIREYLETIGFNKLVKYETKNSKYENAINMAFWWLGKQLDEASNEIKLLYSVFALERLLSNSTSFSSITAAVSEKCAFLLGTTKEQRIEIFERAKSLYDIRSKLAHGSSASVSGKDVTEAYSLAISVLLKIIEVNETINFESIQSLDKYINDIKYQ